MSERTPPSFDCTPRRVPISRNEFRQLSELIRDWCGIRMVPAKMTLLEGRLSKRLRVLGFDSFARYREFLETPEGQRTEMVQMIDAVTTNKTDFFRESKHFGFLVRQALPTVLGSSPSGPRQDFTLWSAGCSTGEEPYSLAMVLAEYAEHSPGLGFSIIATDVSSRTLAIASRAVYDHARVEPVPLELRKKYLLRSRDRLANLVRIAPELRSRVRFQRLNFMEETYDLPDSMDVVFCRNVLIYFDRETQERVLHRICRHLVPGGYLFTGHSETLHGLDLPLRHTAATVYRRVE